MRPKHLVAILVLLALTLPATPAHAGGVVSVCDEAHLKSALSGGGTVTFSCSGTIILTSTIMIAADTTLDGTGRTVTISGNNAVRIFVLNPGISLSLNKLTVANGRVTGFDEYGGGVRSSGGLLTINNSTFSGNSAQGGGGGIYNDLGTVTVSDSTFLDNSADFGGGIRNYAGGVTVSNSAFFLNRARIDGGGIYNAGMLTVSNSTFSSNSAMNYSGGAIYNSTGTVTVSNSTFSENRVVSAGGGIYNYTGMVEVTNSTFSDNSAVSTGGGIHNYEGTVTVNNSTFSGNSAQGGGGLQSGGSLMLRNTIVANSSGEGNCDGYIDDGGGNLSYPDATCPGINANPLLGPLQNNGGPTETMALGTGSAARDAADDAICVAAPVNKLDQRGVTRPQGLHCDIGAYEAIVWRAFLPMIMR